MPTETKLEAFLAIPMPTYELLDPSNESCREDLYAIFDELTDKQAGLSFAAGTGRVSLAFDLLDKSKHESLAEFGIFEEHDFGQCEFVKVSTAVPLSVYTHYHNPEYDIDENTMLSAAVARTEFCKRISDLLVFANIARLGSIELRSSIVVQNGEFLEFSEIPRMDGYAAQCASAIATKMQWPTLQPIPMRTILEWSRSKYETIDGFEGSSMSRALSAFSRLFEKKNAEEPMQLLWALVGIESLYVHGKNELLSQVREKSQVFLGPQESYKKVLSQMYNFRSRFVHGDLGFPSLSLIHEATDEIRKYDAGLTEATSVAISVLGATIQEVVRRGWQGVHFSYAAHPPNDAK